MTAKKIQSAVLGAGLAAILSACALIPPTTPDYPVPRQSTWLSQGWSATTRSEYHHKDQGTLTFGIPYEWFVALEQPNLLLPAPLFHDQTYLDRFGFIPASGALPVGFAKSPEYRDPTRGTVWNNPATGKPFQGVGLTCAACHTGRMTYNGTELLIDGGPALTNLGAFRKALGLSIAFTELNSFRFNRFAARVLGDGDNDTSRAALKEQLKQALAVGQKELPLIEANAARNVEEGFGRLDAINRIGNQVFALDLEEPKNYVATDAPVRFPHIWTAPWYTWVQYNGSIMQPMVRNAGESLGVRALVNLRGPASTRFDSTANIQNLYWIEEALAGKNPWAGGKTVTAAAGAKPVVNPKGETTPRFTGLLAPKWPVSTFPAIDETKRVRGQALYSELCQGCHLPPPGTPAFWASNRWVEIQGNKYLDLKQIPVDAIGTDPAQANGMATRTVILPPDLPLKSNNSGQAPFANALGDVVENVANFWYKKNGIPAAQQVTMNGSRPNDLQVPREYKARTLDGVWAAGPYLHNGSVPTLYDLLSPREKRPTIVHLGGREYDPAKVGYRNVEIKGGFALDTTKPGNSNAGHEFRDGPRGRGVIGRALSDDERWALIEFLKTL